MSRTADLEAYVDSLFSLLNAAMGTLNLPPVVRLEAEEFSRLPSPGVGILLMPPQPGPQEMLLSGELAIWDWQLVIFCCARPQSSVRDGRLYATELAEKIVNHIDATHAYTLLRHDPMGPIEFVVNDATSTIVSLNYVLNWPL